MGCEQQRVGWDGYRGSDGGWWGGGARDGQTRVHALVGHKGLASRWNITLKPSRHLPQGCRCGETLCGSRRCTCGVVAIPHVKKNNLLPSGARKKRSRIRWASLVEGSVVLVSACKVAVPNVEGSGLTEIGRGQWRRLECHERPRPQKCAPGIISILWNKMTRSFTVTVPPMATAGEERKAQCS